MKCSETIADIEATIDGDPVVFQLDQPARCWLTKGHEGLHQSADDADYLIWGDGDIKRVRTLASGVTIRHSLLEYVSLP